MKLLEMDGLVITEHIDELVNIEDYVPLSFVPYDKHHERDEFLRSKNLLSALREMDELVRQKCNYCEDSIKAYNSVLIGWLAHHPEFEGVIAKQSLKNYHQLKEHYDDFTFIDLLYDVELPSEEKPVTPYNYREDVIHKDDSNRMFPNFNRKKEIYEKYGASLLAAYLSYLNFFHSTT